MRSEKTGLLGNTLNVDNLQWVRYDASIGAGADSFYEYMLKSYLLFGNEEYLEMFAGLYVAAMRYLRPKEPGWAAKGWLGEVHLHSGAVMRPWISSLSAFWPGLQATIGGSPCLSSVSLSWHRLKSLDILNSTAGLSAKPGRIDSSSRTLLAFLCSVSQCSLRERYLSCSLLQAKRRMLQLCMGTGLQLGRSLDGYLRCSTPVAARGILSKQ